MENISEIQRKETDNLLTKFEQNNGNIGFYIDNICKYFDNKLPIFEQYKNKNDCIRMTYSGEL